MLLEETIHKSKSLVKKTIQSFKSFFFGGYQKLPKSLSFNAFSCGSSKLKDCKADQIYTDFYEEWESQLDEISKKDSKVAITLEEKMKEEENACSGSFTKIPKNPVKTKEEVELKEKEKKKIGSSHLGKGKESNSKKTKAGGHVLAQKMKELEMVDAGDMEQALDIEEAVHYYSRLKSPVYLDIVDKFFLDMYSDFSLPQTSAKITSSKRRLGSLRF